MGLSLLLLCTAFGSRQAAANPWSDAAREVLVQHCGRCHRGDLATAVPGALAVFDLLEDPWHGRLSAEQLDGLLLRVRRIEGLADVDAAAVERFVRCARDGACGSEAAAAGASSRGNADARGLVVGLDHIPVAVRDLDGAVGRYRRLGFVLKPGRPHENGIRNQHVKFQDGTEIELITASDARDSLTTAYLRHLAAGDGPAFVALYAPDLEAVGRLLDRAGRAHRRDGGVLAFPEEDDLEYVFFGGRNRSPTDRPEHFEHANGAEALVGVWLAGEDLAAERQLLTALGVPIGEEEVHAPEPMRGAVARFREGEVVLLPASRQLVPGRRIVGATVRVRDLGTLRRELAHGLGEAPPALQTGTGSSVFVPPDQTHGIWLEFRERPAPRASSEGPP
jgi:hypothetical protein